MCLITSLLVLLTPPPGLKNVTIIIPFLYPPRNIGIWGKGKKITDIAWGYTCNIIFPRPPYEQLRKYFRRGNPEDRNYNIFPWGI